MAGLTFTKKMQGQLCAPGENATFEAAASSGAGVTATWLKDSKPLDDKLADRVKISSKGNLFSLVLMSCQPGDSGQYTCRITESGGATATCTANLEVHSLSAAEKKQREESSHPVFIVKLRNSELIKDAAASFMIHCRGNPTPDIKIFKDGAELVENSRVALNRDHAAHGSYELVFHKVEAGDAGTYKAEAVNSHGKDTSEAKVAIKDAKDVFALLKGKEKTLKPGEEPTFTWFKGGQEFDPDDRFKVLFKDEEDTLALVFQHINPEDAGLYTCVANTSGGKISCSAELTVEGSVTQMLKAPEPPKILAQLTPAETSPGSSAMMELKMKGYPRPNIRWTKDGKPLVAGDRHKFVYPDPETVALIINKVTGEDVGTYKAVLHNDLGEAATEAKLVLAGAPQFKDPITDVKTGVDEPYKIVAKVTGNPELTWYKDGVPIKEDNRVKCVKKDAETFELVFAKTATEDNGNWAVIARNPHGEMSQFFQFAAQMLPKFEAKLTDTEANESKQVVLKCKIKCEPRPDIKWFKNGQEITKDPRVKVYLDPTGNDCLTINSASRGMAGEYEIRATNEMGTASCKCNLKVNTKPSAEDMDEVVEAFETDDYTFAVECDGSPKPVAKWTKDGKNIDTSAKDSRFFVSEAGGVYKLRISKVEMDDAGTYQVEFTNRAGDKKLQSELKVHSMEELRIPKCMSDLKDKKANKGAKTFFNIKIRGDPLPTVQWLINDQEIVESDIFKISVKEDEFLYRLDILDVQSNTAGKISVIAKNENGEDRKDGSLEVQFSPEIDDIGEWKAGPGDEAKIIAKARAFPFAEGTWYRVLEEAPAEGGEAKVEKIDTSDKAWARYSMAVEENGLEATFILTIKDAKLEDAGAYELSCANRVGHTEARARLLVITEEPSFPKPLADITTTLGATATFVACVAGVPKPSVEWYQGDQPLQKGKRRMFEEELTAEGTIYKMTVRDIIMKDFGEIILKASNMVGESVSPCTFQIIQIKPTIQADFPKMQEVKEGGLFELSAKIDGSPPPTAIWLCEGEEIKADGERVIITCEEAEDGNGFICTLKITKCGDEDNGKYTLLVKNTAGETKLETMLDVMGKPKAPKVIHEIEPKEIIIPGKKDLRLKAKISGFPMPTISWLRDGNEIKVRKGVLISQDASGGATLVVEKCTMSDAGVYTARGVNEVGDCETSCTVLVTQAMEEPKFTSLLRSAKAVEGSPIKLEGKMVGHPPPEIKWMYNDQEWEPDNNRIKQFVNPDGTFGLIFESTLGSDKGAYVAIAYNSEGTARSLANIAIKTRLKEGVEKAVPSFVRPMGDISVDEGQKLRITTPIRGNPIPEFSWTKNGKPLDGRAHFFSDGELIGVEVADAKVADSGAYECHLSNELGSVTGVCNADVKKVYSEPLFSKPLNNIKQLLNCDAKFVCEVNSNPRPEISWYFNGQCVEEDARHKIKTNGMTRMLLIKKIQESDVGSYSCVAKNQEGTIESRGSLEIVEFVEKGRHDAPEFLKKIGDELVFRGMAARFTALVTGTPEPEFEFYFNNKPMFPTDRIHIVKERTGLIRLSMAYVEETDIGIYKLRVWNKHGEATCEAKLVYDGLEVQPDQSLGNLYQGFEKYTVGGLPMPLPDKPLITQMSDTKVTLTWKPALPLGPNLAPYYMVEMAEYPDGDWSEIYEEVRGITCDINGLTPLRDYRFRVSVRNRFGLSDPSPYAVAHRSNFATDCGPKDLFLQPGQPFDLTASTRFPRGFDIYKEPYEGYTHRPHFLKQEEVSQYAVKNSCPEITWNLYGFPMPSVHFKFEGKDLEIDGDKFTMNYTRNGVVKLQINSFQASDIGTYECYGVNDYGSMMQPVLVMMAQYPEFIKAPTDVHLIGVNGGKVECEIYGVPKPKVSWFKDFVPLKETSRVQAHHYPPQTYTLFFEDYITKDEGLYTVTASNICGSISYSVMVRILEDEQEFEWMTYRRSKQIIPRTKGFDKFYHTCEEIGRGTQGITYFVQQIVPIESEQSGHHAVEEAESKYWWLHRSVKQGGQPTQDPCMIPYRFTGGNFAAKMMHGHQYKSWMMNEFEMMNVLHHPRLIRLVEVYDSRDQMTLISELATGGELLDVITSEKYITEIEIARIIQQILEGIEYMHSKSIGHLSLTPCDVLFTRPGGSEIKICDFSLARRIVGVVKMEYGQPEYVAPEIVNGEGATFASDMWSIGIITYLILSGVSPFRGQNDRETLQRIQMGDIDFDFELWQNVSREAKHFVANLLVYKPEERMSVRQALAHPWLQILKQPGIEISDQYQISTERLRNYYVGLKEWITNAACDYLYRRRPLHGAFTHPSCMVYPPNEPAADVEPEPVPKAPERQEYRRPSYTIEPFENPSNYQYGPDTYLLQVRDADFPARLREYLSVARTHSAEFKDVKCPIVKERRRFTDVMDEELEAQRDARLDAWGRDDFSVFKPKKLVPGDGVEEIEITTTREVIDGVTPFFREKPHDLALTEGEPLKISCLVASEPKAAIQWLKNDLIFMDDSRLRIVNTEDGWSHLSLDPAMPSDAGLYKVVARNPLGQVSCSVRVVLGDISGPPDSPTVEAMTDTDILLSWVTPSQLNHSPIICYKVQMGYIDTDIDWVDLADDITHEYFVVDNLRPSHGYKFRILAKNQFGWSIPSIPSGIVMTPSSGASRAEFYDCLQRVQAKGDMEVAPAPLSYETERKPMKLRNEGPGALDFMNEIAKGRFSVTANVNKDGRVFSVKAFDKSSAEGAEAAQREFKNLKTLRHEKMVTLVDAFETDRMSLLQFAPLPSTDLLAYIAERPWYTEQMVAEIAGQILDALDYIHWRGKVYLNLEPANILVTSGRSLGRTVQVKLANFETTQTVAASGTAIKGTYNFDYAAPEIIEEAKAYPQSDVWSFGVLLYVLMSGQLPFKGDTPEETKDNILQVRFKFEWLYKECTMEGTRLLMWIFKHAPYRRPSLEEVGAHRWLNPADYMLKKRMRARFPTNRIQAFSRDYHRSRPVMDQDSQSFLSRLNQ